MSVSAALLSQANDNLTALPTMTAYHCRTISTLQEFQPLQPQWDAFLEKADIHNLSMTHGFLTQWLMHFPPDKLLILIVEDEQGNWAGIAPLQINRSRRGLSHRLLKQVQWIGTQPTVFDWMTLGIHPDANETAVIQAMARQLLEEAWDVLDLEFALDRRQLLQLCEALRLQPAETALWQCCAMPYIPLPDNAADYEKMRRKKTRLDTNRFCNLLKRHFDEPWQIEYKSLTPESEKLIDQFIDIHIEYWALRSSTSDFKRFPKLGSFYKALLAEADKAKDDRTPRLLFNVITLGSNVLSYHFDFWQGDSYLAHIICYNQSFRKFGPGILHMDQLVFEALNRKSREFSFGRGDEPYKAMWTNKKKPLWQLRLFRTTLAKRIWQIDPFLKKLLGKGAA
jgi:CelD/BcsL family acetyltransferase involved in cellulose biosynthesis